ncbi:MAG: hypothetical protein HYS13_06325 [Planctomycetia bacterium]|nr:hypothetical protein [Planctomycetia bacterium]
MSAAKRTGVGIVVGISLAVCAGLSALLGAASPRPAAAEPPADQTYTGLKRCSACHFDQFLKWRATPHAKTFEVLTAKHQSDAECLKCHTTGHGEPTGFKDPASTPGLVGVTCETCHGPGSKHEEIAKPFTNKKLTPEQEKEVRGSIWKMLPKNVCVDCHRLQGHHDSETPPEMRKKK